MTSQAPPGPDYQDFSKRCRQAGLRCTQQRWEIYRELTGARDHPSAEVLHGRLKDRLPSLSLDTVYRTLATLEDHGLACRVHCATPSARYDHAIHPHHHMVCRCCGQMQDFTWDVCGLDTLPRQVREWGKPIIANLVVEGICAACERDRTCQTDDSSVENGS